MNHFLSSSFGDRNINILNFYFVDVSARTSSATVSTWLERVVLIASLSSNPLFLVVTSPTIPLYLREQVKAEILRKCLYFSNRSRAISGFFTVLDVLLLVIGQRHLVNDGLSAGEQAEGLFP